MKLAPALAAASLVINLSACGGGGGEADNVAGGDPVAEGEALLPNEAEAAELANEAAADEAADMNAFGGDAAAGETGNSL